jgi:hypothetical protein
VLPGNLSAVSDLWMSVSPLDARTIFVQFYASASETSPYTYISGDAGESWQRVKLPIPGEFSSFLPQPLTPPPLLRDPLRAQGTHLFAMDNCYALGCGWTHPELVTTTDGGVTWATADDGIRAAGQIICDFAVSSAGSDVFAFTAPSGCNSGDPLPAEQLWHSADSGAHWSHISTLTMTIACDLHVVPRAGQTPLLYALNLYPVAKPNGYGLTLTPHDVQASVDGGRTWQSAPSAGIQRPLFLTSRPLGVLSDGTLLVGFASALGRQETIYGWKLGQSTWEKITPPTLGPIDAFTAVPGPDGSNTLLAEVDLGEKVYPNNPAANIVTQGVELFVVAR